MFSKIIFSLTKERIIKELAPQKARLEIVEPRREIPNFHTEWHIIIPSTAEYSSVSYTRCVEKLTAPLRPLRKCLIRCDITAQVISRVQTAHENSGVSSGHGIAINRPGERKRSLRKLFLSRSLVVSSLPLILYAECNEFRVLSRACGLTVLTVASPCRCTARLLLFLSFLSCHPLSPFAFTLLCPLGCVDGVVHRKQWNREPPSVQSLSRGRCEYFIILLVVAEKN